MPAPAESQILVEMAAEGIAGLVKGCASVLANPARIESKNALGDVPHLKGINYFGLPIVNRWIEGFPSKEGLVHSIGLLAASSVEEGRPFVTAAVEKFALDARPEDKAVAVEYLAAIPLSLRRALVADPTTGQMIVPTTLLDDNGRTFLGLLPSDVPPFPIGTELPNTSYRLTELLGIGGFGAVYKALNLFEQNQPPRAIKFCLDPSMIASLHRERAILDRLMAVAGDSWSNRIVRLYGYALDANPPFLVYEYVPGGDLTSYIITMRQKLGRGFRPDAAFAVVRQVAEGLAFAHSQGLVHRDLKPANVLVSGASIKLTDFGIGGIVASHAMRTSTLGGMALSKFTATDQVRLFRGSGTPLYMSPEQRRGEQPDPRHDLYSLGVLWYQILVGDVTRELHPGWPDELTEEFQTPKEHIEIIQRCVGYFKKRPVNAGELLKHLQALMSSTGARQKESRVPPSKMPNGTASTLPNLEEDFDTLRSKLMDQIGKDCFREADVTVNLMLRLKPKDKEALDARVFIQKSLDLSRSELPSFMAASSPLEKPPGPAVAAITEVNSFQGHKGWVRSVAFGSDGSQALSAGDDTFLCLWNLDNQTLLHRFTGHSAAVMSVAFSPNRLMALSGSWDGSVRVWSLDQNREMRAFRGGWKCVKAVAYSPDNRQALAGTDDTLIHLWDVETGQEIRQFAGHTDLVHGVAFSPDGRRVLSGGDDGTVRLWEVESGRELVRFLGHTDSVTSVAFSSSGRWVLSGSSDGTARLWDVAAGRELRRLEGHGSWVNSVAIAPDSRRALTGSGGEIINGKFQDGADKTVRLWDLSSGKEISRFSGHAGSVTSVAFSPVGRLILSGSLDKTVRLLMLPS